MKKKDPIMRRMRPMVLIPDCSAKRAMPVRTTTGDSEESEGLGSVGVGVGDDMGVWVGLVEEDTLDGV